MERFSKPLARLSRALVVALALTSAAGPVHAQAADSWEMTKIEGRDYVSADSLKRVYGFTDMSRSGNTLTLVKKSVDRKTGKTKVALDVRLSIGGNECLMNDVKFIFSQEIVSSGDKVYISRLDLAKLVDPVLRPNFIQNAGDFRTVILDPGHGGKDPGATNPLGTEAAYNFKVAGMVKRQLEKDGYKVVMTRETDIYQSLQERVEIANRVKDNAIFISIHFNSGGSAARGIETFTLSPQGVSHYGRGLRADDAQARTGNEHDSANIALATAVHGTVLTMLNGNTLDRGIKRARFSVLSGVSHPAILLEGGFMTHPTEARLIDNEKYQAALAGGICRAVLTYRAAMNLKTVAAN